MAVRSGLVMNKPQATSFELTSQYESGLRQKLFHLVKGPIEKICGLNKLSEMYSELPENASGLEFLNAALATLNIHYLVTDEDRKKIPESGPVIAISNHPYGGIEGIILAHLFQSCRPDVKILANFLLHRISQLRDLFIFVDPFGGNDSFRKNIGPLRETMEWVNNGGLLSVFPAGTVSHLDLQKREITDPPWSPTIARIIRKTEAPVLPVFFQGTNGFLFQLLGMLHPRLRTAMLPNELLNKRSSTFRVNVGSLIPAERLLGFENDDEMLAYLRLRTYIMKNRNPDPRAKRKFIGEMKLDRKLEPIVPPVDQKLLIDDVNSIPPEQVLVESGEYLVIQAWAPQIPNVMREIGRLREVTFRKVHEGTGRSIDLDQFDNYYVHLFVWNKDAREIVGAYRLGQSDLILDKYGIEGLYTSTQFAYQNELFAQIGPALELGRSWVRQEYQKNYSPLLLLWKGIGHFTAMNPRYKVLFGPVSINNQYDSLSRHLIALFLENNSFLSELAEKIRARNPFRTNVVKNHDLKATSTVVRDIEEVSELVREIETEHTGVPVLLRQYLKLGGKLVGFNIDPDFGDVLDGLLLVDLTKTERKLLDRYLGRDGAENFLRYHGVSTAQSASAEVETESSSTSAPKSLP